MRHALGIAAGYAVIVAMGLFLLIMAVIAITDTAPPHDALWIVMVVALLVGVAAAVASVQYELSAPTPKERIRRHMRMQAASAVALAVGVVLLIAAPLLPPVVRVAAASGFSGFVFGFLAMFIPNRRRALEIRNFGPDD